MNAKSALIIAAIVFIFTGCASENIQVRKLPDSAINAGLEDLRQEVADNGVPGEENRRKRNQTVKRNAASCGTSPSSVWKQKSKRAKHSSRIIPAF